jgi:hypothetical protein
MWEPDEGPGGRDFAGTRCATRMSLRSFCADVVAE